jgi:hypothetical protein
MKNSIALISLSLFTTLASASMFPQDSKGEAIWQIEGQGLYANQSNNLPALYGAGGTGGGSSISSVAQQFSDIIAQDPEEHWGFGGRIGYVLPSHKYDVQLRYFGINMTGDRNASAFTPPLGNTPYTYDTDENFNFNSAEIMFGNYYKPTKRLMLRASYGIAFADIEQQSTTSLIGIGDPGNVRTKLENSFVGAGPKVMLDGDFAITRPFSVVGSVGMSLLYGEAEVINHFTQTESGPGNDFDAPYENSDNRVAVGFDSKLGFRYAQTMGERASINLEAGYKLAAYLNAMEDQDIELIVPNGGPFLLSESESNYTYAGPYVNLGVDFM